MNTANLVWKDLCFPGLLAVISLIVGLVAIT
jgi:hypothetical protein